MTSETPLKRCSGNTHDACTRERYDPLSYEFHHECGGALPDRKAGSERNKRQSGGSERDPPDPLISPETREVRPLTDP